MLGTFVSLVGGGMRVKLANGEDAVLLLDAACIVTLNRVRCNASDLKLGDTVTVSGMPALSVVATR